MKSLVVRQLAQTRPVATDDEDRVIDSQLAANKTRHPAMRRASRRDRDSDRGEHHDEDDRRSAHQPDAPSST
jgi:hypothetical protein